MTLVFGLVSCAPCQRLTGARFPFAYLMSRSAAPLSRAPHVASIQSARALRVLHVFAPATVGGLERVVCSLTRAQQDAGIETRVAAVVEPDAEESPVVAELRASGVAVDEIRVPPRAYSLERRKLAAICARWRPDVLHSHGYRCDLVDSRVAGRLAIPRVSTMHGFTGGGPRNRLYEWLQRREARRMDAVIAVSRAIGDQLAASKVRRERLHVVPNAYSPRASFTERSAARRELGLPPDAYVIGWVGRLTAEKGADVLVDALAHLDGESVFASFVGDGNQRPSLAARSAATAPGTVFWHGIVLDAARLLRAFDVFVLSSRTEGTPMVLFEAMNAGIPIVATRVGGVPDVLRPDDALLVNADDPESLAAAIRETMRNPAAARARVVSARARLDAEYTVAPWVERHATIYRQLLRNTKPQ
jgi:glycosyltransferase involved in cell wall biosynthesis